MSDKNGGHRSGGNERGGQDKKPGRLLDRTPPSSAEIEDRLLCCMMVKSSVCDEVATLVRASDFVQEGHGILYEHLLALHEKSRHIEVPLLIERLKQAKVLDRVGGVAEIMRIAAVLPHAAFAKDYARTIREYSAKRKLIEACTQSLCDAYDSDEQVDEILSRAEQRIYDITDQRYEQEVRTLASAIEEAIDRLDRRLGNMHSDDCIGTGFPDLDNLTAGFHRRELSILAARPSMGKTALALNMAEHVAIHLQEPVLFVSLEMAAIELTNRLLCSRARVDGQRVRRGGQSHQDQSRMIDEAGRIAQCPLFIDESTSRNVTGIAATARRVSRMANQRLALIVIDYLQLIEPDNPKDPRQEQVAKITRRLKGLARDLGVPVLCLAQLNRQAEMTKDSRPRLSHLRESGAIEQDADVVMFIHREDYYMTGDEKEENKGRASLMVAKQRNGPIGDVDLLFHDKYARFVSAERREREPDFRVFDQDSSEDF